MGQRSHIIVVIDTKDYKRVIANYYQWNYGERMISRARGGIEWAKYFFDNKRSLGFEPIKIERIWDVNFDMRDIAVHANLLEEYKEYGNEEVPVLKWIGFEGDGGLVVHITDDTFEYTLCTLDGKVLTPEEYIVWDLGNNEKSFDDIVSTLDEDDIEALKDNIEYLGDIKLMTQEELDAVLNADYTGFEGI